MGKMKIENLNKSVVQFVLLLVALACVFVIILGIQSSAYIINSILLAVLITLAVMPIPRKLIQRGMKPSLALVLSLLLVVGVLVLIFALAFASINSVSEEISSASTSQSPAEQGDANTSDILARIQNSVSTEDVNQILSGIVSAFAAVASQFLAVMLIFIFMLSAVVVTPIADQMADVTEDSYAQKLSDLTKDVQQYISITTLINFLVGLGNAIILLILGVPFAILWGILAWIMGYIPVVGFWIALIPPTLLAWVTLGFPTAVVVFLAFVIINGSVENFIKPRVMGEGLNISPLIVFISIFIWGWILGGAGAIAAIPITLLILSVLDSFEATRWIVVLLRPPSTSEEHERDEAHSKLRDLWGKASNAVKGHDDEAEEDNPNTEVSAS
jgi:predicted PurR-regulated permease PerM